MGFGGAAKAPPPSLHPRMQVVTCTSKKLQHARYRRAIAPRKAIARIRLDRVQSRNAHHHVDAIVDLLALQIGARTVGFQILNLPHPRCHDHHFPKYGWHEQVRFSNFDLASKDSARAPTGLLQTGAHLCITTSFKPHTTFGHRDGAHGPLGNSIFDGSTSVHCAQQIKMSKKSQTTECWVNLFLFIFMGHVGLSIFTHCYPVATMLHCHPARITYFCHQAHMRLVVFSSGLFVSRTFRGWQLLCLILAIWWQI